MFGRLAFILVVGTASSAFAANLTTVAGNGTPGFSGDGGPAISAELQSPRGLAVAADGSVYFSDLGNFRIRQVDAAGVIHTVAGVGTYSGPPGSGDGGAATSAEIGDSFAVALSPNNSKLYIADTDDNRVRVVDLTTGQIDAFAGDGFSIDFGAPGPAVNAGLASPTGVAVDPNTGNVFIVDTGSCNVRKVDVSTAAPQISTIAGDPNCTRPSAPIADGTPATSALFYSVARVSVDSASDIFVLDNGDTALNDPGNVTRRVYKIDHTTGLMTTVAGGGATVPGFGAATSMNIGKPQDLSTDVAGTLYVATLTQVFKVDLSTGILSVFAGTGVNGFSPDGTVATSASLTNVQGVTVRSDTIWISETGSARIRAVVPPPAIPIDVIVDAATTDDFLNSINAVQGSVIMVTVGGRTALVMKGLGSVGSNVTVDNNNDLLVVDLDALQSVGGNIDISGNLAMTSIDLSSLATVGGNLNIANDPSVSAVLISGITSIGGNLTLIGTSATVFNLSTLTTVGGNLNLSDNTAATDINLGGLTSTGGDLSLDNNGAATVNLGSLSTVGGNLSLSGDPTLGSIDLGTVTGVGGNLTLDADPTATTANLGSLTSVGGSVDISSDPALTTANLGLLNSTGGNLSLSGDTSLSTVNLGSLSLVGGNLSLTSDPSVTNLDLGSLSSANNLTITGDTSLSSVNLGNLSTVGSNLTIDNNATDTTNVNLGSLNSVGGDLTLQTNGTGVFNLGTGATTVGGNLDLTTNGYGSVSGTTATGNTSITSITVDATLHLQIAAADFSAPTQFTLTHLDPTALPPESGTAADGTAATIDPVVGYAFNFTTPVLNTGTSAALTFDVNLAGLSAADRGELLTAVQSGTASIVTKPDAAGSTYQAFSVCGATEQPTPGGCVQITLLDANGNPTTGTPATIRFSNLVSHFSSWAVAVVTPAAQCPNPSSDLCADLTGYTTTYTRTLVRNAGEELILDQDFAAVSSDAIIVVHNNGCTSGVVTLNGTDVISGLDLATKGQCFDGDVPLVAGNNHVHVDLGATGGTLGTASRKGHCGGGHGGGGHGGDGDGHDGDGDGHDGDGHDGDGHHGDDDDDHEGCPTGQHHANHGHHYGWEHSHHHSHDNDDSDCVPDTTGGEGEGSAAGGEGEGSAAGGEGEGSAVGGEGEGSAVGGEGEGSVAGGEGEGSAAGGEGEGAAAGGEGEGSAAGGEGEGSAAGGEGEGSAAGGEGEGEGSVGGSTDQGCTVTLSVEELTQCSGSPSASTTPSSGSCASSGTAPAALGLLALGLLGVRRRRR